MFGLSAFFKPKGNTSDAISAHIASRDLDLVMVTEGDPTHHHDFKEVLWDSGRFGSEFTADSDHGTAIEFPMATVKSLYRCHCGAEGTHSLRGLI